MISTFNNNKEKKVGYCGLLWEWGCTKQFYKDSFTKGYMKVMHCLKRKLQYKIKVFVQENYKFKPIIRGEDTKTITAKKRKSGSA